MAFYGDGQFDFVEDSARAYYQNAHWALTETNMWEWLATFTPPNNQGFMYCNDDNLTIVERKMFEQDVAQNHTGATFGITMINMKYIAENGYDAFRTLYLNQNQIYQQNNFSR